jgi:two-component system sensor histidine kinase PilS (NtrC family)
LVTEILELGRRDRAEPEYLYWNSFSMALIEEYALHEPSVSSRVTVSGQDILFRFDRAHLHRVLWNLLSNALRHASNQDGAVRLELRDQGLSGSAALHVIDDGSGIDPELRAQIFEPFFTTGGNGTGLGLYIARELCEANGATLDLLDNAPGAHFRVTMEKRG